MASNIVLPTTSPGKAGVEIRKIVHRIKQMGLHQSASTTAPFFNGYQDADYWLARMNDASKARKVTAYRAAEVHFKDALSKERTTYKAKINAMKKPNISAEFFEMLDRLDVLSQSFPTTNDVPKTDDAMVIRAIVSILRTQGVEGAKEIGVTTLTMEGGDDGDEDDEEEGEEYDDDTEHDEDTEG